jgi:eukaryotic-like serine/threonine-protein kinase
MNARLVGAARRAGVAMAAIVLAVGGAVAVGASPAQAAGCSVPSHRPNGEGLIFVHTSVWMHSGPYDACPLIHNMYAGDTVWAYCTYHNSYGNLWYYGRVDGTSFYGWLYGGNGDVGEAWYDDNKDGIFSPATCS